MCHEQKQRDGTDGVIGGQIIGGNADAHHGGIKADEQSKACGTHKAHGKADGHAKRYEAEQEPQAGKADHDGGHLE